MFDDIPKPKNINAVEWYEYGLQQGLKLKDVQSKWVLNAEDRISCRNCGYIAPYDVSRGYCCGSFCASCGAKMEEFKKERDCKRERN